MNAKKWCWLFLIVSWLSQGQAFAYEYPFDMQAWQIRFVIEGKLIRSKGGRKSMPTFEISLFPDGTVKYKGVRGTKQLGEAESKIDRSQALNLFAEIYFSGFFQIANDSKDKDGLDKGDKGDSAAPIAPQNQATKPNPYFIPSDGTDIFSGPFRSKYRSITLETSLDGVIHRVTWRPLVGPTLLLYLLHNAELATNSQQWVGQAIIECGIEPQFSCNEK